MQVLGVKKNNPVIPRYIQESCFEPQSGRRSHMPGLGSWPCSIALLPPMQSREHAGDETGLVLWAEQRVLLQAIPAQTSLSSLTLAGCEPGCGTGRPVPFVPGVVALSWHTAEPTYPHALVSIIPAAHGATATALTFCAFSCCPFPGRLPGRCLLLAAPLPGR